MPITVTAWVVALALIAGLLVLDWLRLGRRPHEIELGEALRWSAFYVTVALLFGVGVGVLAGWDLGGQYFAGYLVEKSLSVDNLFVFVIIIGNFAVPPAQQPKVLTIGIVVALGLRGVFIALGAALLDVFSFMFLAFGLVLMATAVQLYRHRKEDPSVEDNVLVRLARRHLPLSEGYEGGRILSGARGHYVLTPLFLALLAIGTSDLLFAFDSIPAVFGVTDHAYIVFCANAFALLGLRALYFLVDDLLRRLVHLSTGLAVILAFIGIKLVLEFTHHQVPAVPAISTGLSLAVIAAILGVTTVASLLARRRDAGAHASAGTLRRPRSPAAAERSPSPPRSEPAVARGRSRSRG